MSGKLIKIYDISNQQAMGSIAINDCKRKYNEWRAKGYGVLLDSDGDICIDMEDSADDGLNYLDQLKAL